VGLEPDFQGIDEKEGSTLTRNFTGSVTGQGLPWL
jgi:hypothetical protein